MWQIEYYTKPGGECPVKDLIRSLDQARDKRLITDRIDMLAVDGNTLRRPHVDLLEDGIYELRIKCLQGQVRIFYFFFERQTIVLTHGIVKKQSDVPQKEIKRAKKIRTGYFLDH